MKKLSCLFLAMIMVLSLLVGCSGGNNNSGSNNDRQNDANTPSDSNTDNNNTEQTYSGKVMLYSSMQEDQLMAIKEGFEKKYPGVTMEYYFAGTSKVVTKISTEAQAGHVDADVIWVGDAADYVSFKEEGILQQYTSPRPPALTPTTSTRRATTPPPVWWVWALPTTPSP